jgi:hypothetical protein
MAVAASKRAAMSVFMRFIVQISRPAARRRAFTA